MDAARPIRWQRAVVAGALGGLAWNGAMVAFFGPAQLVLADPELQSPKMLAAFMDPEALPRMAAAPWILPVLLLVLGIVYGLVFAVIAGGLPGRTWWTRGSSFGLVAWALGFLWFEAYLPWNVLLEPVSLVAFELVLWLAVLQVVGLVIARIYGPHGEL
jgi:hypothetical protein